MRLTDWWDTPAWHAYERAFGDEPDTRSRLLASATWRTRVVDLAQDEAALWRDVRKSYHAIVNRLTREFRPWDHAGERQVIDGKGAAWVVRTCELLHKADAGRQTRSDDTWQLMGQWAETGNGLFVVAFDYNQPPHKAMVAANPLMVNGTPIDMGEPLPCVGYVFFVRHQDWAYYFSAATLRRDINIALVWWAMLALKARGVRWCELGWVDKPDFSEKEKRIAFFKSGFGGVDVAIADCYRS